MATEGRGADHYLAERLFSEAYRFDFFQAVRLLERLYPKRQRVGRGDTAPADEVVRFRTRPSLAFPPSQLYSIAARNGDAAHAAEAPPPEPVEMTVAFMGLTGPLGVLPDFYTELVAERARQKDKTLWEFLDLFNHRLLSLFYRAWEKYRFPIGYERDRADAFTEYLFHLIGLGGRELRGDQLHLPDRSLLFYGGLIMQRPHSANAVEAIISDYFKVPARVEQFAGQWLELEEDEQTRLGAANHELGVSAIAGTRVWDDQSKFRLLLGPMKFTQFISFLPPGQSFKPLTGLVGFLVGQEFDFDVQLALHAAEVPACHLTTQPDTQPRLGWTTWLKTRDFARDDSQVVFAVEA
jgi:type VI secretion system protein ImpH